MVRRSGEISGFPAGRGEWSNGQKSCDRYNVKLSML
jgi:hypothetical protein